jgi:hypothetical protein
MTRILSFVGFIFIIYSCTTSSLEKNTVEKAFVSLDDVKRTLAKSDEIPQDSIHVIKLKETGLYITQGLGRVDNMIRLLKLHKDHFEILDSLTIYQEDDSFGFEKIGYDFKNDWFITRDIGTGSSSLSLSRSLIRIKNNRFANLFSYTKYFFAIDPETFPVSQETVETRELEMNKKQIILITSYRIEYESSSGIHPDFKDTVVFEFSKSQNSFVKKRFADTAMEEKWSSDNGEYLFGL